jgi:hypothetical protein
LADHACFIALIIHDKYLSIALVDCTQL